MQKAKINLIIEAVMFWCLMALAGTGFLRKFRLPGQGGRGYGTLRQETLFWGIDRQSWSDIHLWLGYVMLALLALHIVLHWKEINIIYRRLIPYPAVRVIVAIVFAVLSLGLLLFSFV